VDFVPRRSVISQADGQKFVNKDYICRLYVATKIRCKLQLQAPSPATCCGNVEGDEMLNMEVPSSY
jgi:hypothetical protein